MTEPRVFVRTEQGDIDITEGVKTMYDLLVESMDWGSGFLSLEDVIEVSRLAQAMGFVSIPEADEQVRSYVWSRHKHCPTCHGWVDYDYRTDGSGWEMSDVTPTARVMTARPCGHRFILETPPGQPASLMPIPGGNE